MSKLYHIAALSLITLCVAAAYHHTLDVPFIFDDSHAIEENHKIRDISNYLSFSSLTLQRPLVDLTFSLNYHLGELEVLGYHIVNIIIHILTSMMVYVLALTIFKRLSAGSPCSSFSKLHFIIPAALAALIFALHPVQTQAVTYIVQRYTSMSAMFYIGSVLFYVLGRQVMSVPFSRPVLGISAGHFFLPVKTLIYFLLCMLFALASFLSKQIALSLPLAIMLMEYALFDQTWEGWKKKLLYMIPFLAFFTGFVLYSTGVLQGDISFGRLLEEADQRTRETMDVTRLQYLFTQFQVMIVYLRLLVWPVNLSLDYMFPFVDSFFEARTIVSMTVLLFLSASALMLRKQVPVFFIGVFWFFITLSVESTIIPISDALFEHRLYLPMFGFALVLAYTLQKIREYTIYGFTAFAAALIIFTGAVTYERNAIWSDPGHLWKSAVDSSPDNYRAYNNLGNVFLEDDFFDIEKAQKYFQKSLTINPDFVDANHNYGLTLFYFDRYDEAAEYFNKALKGDYQVGTTYYYLGLIYEDKGKAEEAISYFQKAVDLDKTDTNSIYSLAYNLFYHGQEDEARVLLEDNMLLLSNHAYALQLLGKYYYRKQSFDQALSYFDDALRISPENTRIMFNRGLALIYSGRTGEATDVFREIYRLDPENQQALEIFLQLIPGR